MTYRIYFDEFCPEFVEWLRNKFRVVWQGKFSMMIDLQHTDERAEQIVNLIDDMMYQGVDSPKWDRVTRAIISLCPWL